MRNLLFLETNAKIYNPPKVKNRINSSGSLIHKVSIYNITQFTEASLVPTNSENFYILFQNKLLQQAESLLQFWGIRFY